ncbi:Protein of unknown function, partial [Gryllus bimaculatus]
RVGAAAQREGRALAQPAHHQHLHLPGPRRPARVRVAARHALRPDPEQGDALRGRVGAVRQHEGGGRSPARAQRRAAARALRVGARVPAAQHRPAHLR